MYIGLSVFLSVSRECGGSIMLRVKLDRPRVIGDVGVKEKEKKKEKKKRESKNYYGVKRKNDAVSGLGLSDLGLD